MGRIAGLHNRLTTETKHKLQQLIDDVITSIELKNLNTNQKLKLSQILLQYTLPRHKIITDDTFIEPSEVQVNILTTTEEKDRLEKVREYE
tara:strand:+ start:143 stop:415 length:273 start_codon:yes stop_codon:yes gene_type:complete